MEAPLLLGICWLRSSTAGMTNNAKGTSWLKTDRPQALLLELCCLGSSEASWQGSELAIFSSDLAGILIQSTTYGSYWQRTVGRIVNSIALGVFCNTITIYQSEYATAKIRGTLVNFYQFWLLTDSVPINICN